MQTLATLDQRLSKLASRVNHLELAVSLLLRFTAALATALVRLKIRTWKPLGAGESDPLAPIMGGPGAPPPPNWPEGADLCGEQWLLDYYLEAQNDDAKTHRLHQLLACQLVRKEAMERYLKKLEKDGLSGVVKPVGGGSFRPTGNTNGGPSK